MANARNIPTIFVRNVGGKHKLWLKGCGYEAPAGTRLLKGATKEFPGGPPDIAFEHDKPAAAFRAAELLQGYINSL